jgi:hypothetical protein
MFSIKNEEKNIKMALIVIEAIFMCLALYVVFTHGDSMLLGSLEKFDNDDVKYIRSAWTLIDKGILAYENTVESTVFIMPGLTVILSFFMLIFGRMGGIVAFKVFQVFVQMVSLYLVFLIGRKVFNSKIGIFACVLDLFYLVEVFTANIILMEVLFKFFFLLLIYISMYAIESRQMKYYIYGGVIWGAACLFRPTVAAYPIVILVLWIKKKYSFVEIAKFTIVVTAIFCTVMSPWWIRNYRTFGRFITFTKSSGNPFLQGTYINYNQSVDHVPYDRGEDLLEGDKIEIQTGLYRLRTYGSQKPLQYIYWYTVGKTIYFWNGAFYWREVLKIHGGFVYVYHLIILLFGVIGVRRKSKGNFNALVLTLSIAYLNLIYLPYFTFSRYSYPLMPLVMIFSSVVMYELWHNYTRSKTLKSYIGKTA